MKVSYAKFCERERAIDGWRSEAEDMRCECGGEIEVRIVKMWVEFSCVECGSVIEERDADPLNEAAVRY